MKTKHLQRLCRTAFIAISGLSLLPLLAACSESQDTTEEDSNLVRVVRIGHIGPLSGPTAHLGKDNENGVALAIDEANAAAVMIGGEKIRFEMVSEDDQDDPRKAKVVARKIVHANVAGVIGHLKSDATIAASKVYFDAGIAQISPSTTHVGYTRQGYKTAFRVLANNAQQGTALSDFAVEKLNTKRIAVIDDRSEYGQGLADQFEVAVRAAGGEVVTREFTDITKTDFTAILTQIREMNPDLVFCGCLDSQTGPMLKQFRKLGLAAIFLSGDGSRTRQFITLAGDAAEGVYASSPGVPLDKMRGGLEFKEKYQRTFNQEIQLYAPYAYDAANTLIAALQQADSTDPAVYLPILANIEHAGVSGTIRFDERGDIRGGSISLYRVVNGQWQHIETLGEGR